MSHILVHADMLKGNNIYCIMLTHPLRRDGDCSTHTGRIGPSQTGWRRPGHRQPTRTCVIAHIYIYTKRSETSSDREVGILKNSAKMWMVKEEEKTILREHTRNSLTFFSFSLIVFLNKLYFKGKQIISWKKSFKQSLNKKNPPNCGGW